MGDIIWQEASIQVKIFYIFVLLAFVYTIIKYRKNKFSVLVILIFFNGLFAFFGKNIQNGYRIGLVLLTLYWLYKSDPFNYSKYGNVIISFVFFTLTFLFTSFNNSDYFFIIFSQYSRYFILFSLFFILKKYCSYVPFSLWLEKLIYDLLRIQVILSVVKLIIIGPTESIVGSVASQGGAVATSLPLLGFMVIWVNKRGKLERDDWFFIAGLGLIGFMSLKRAIWFIMPVLITLLMFYVPRRKIPNKVILLSVLAIPLIFYVGLRLEPTLNREGKIWGSFDPEYAFNYAQVYTFGEKDKNEKGAGRGGATLLLFDKIVNNDIGEKDWTGYGLRFIYAVDYNEFQDLNLGINHLGSATGVFQTMVSNGYLGIVALLWFIISMLLKTKNRRLRTVIILFFCWEYFLYTGIVIRELSLSFLLIYVVIASDYNVVATKEGTITKRISN
jgi:hypothetical protein